MTDPRTDALERELNRLKEQYPTAYITRTEFHSRMDIEAGKALDREERILARIDKVASDLKSDIHREVDEVKKNVQHNEDRIDQLRNIGAVIIALDVIIQSVIEAVGSKVGRLF